MSTDKLKGITLYTEGDNNSMTLGDASTIVVGGTNQISVGGQTNFTFPMDATVAVGTYFEGVFGNNVTYTEGPTLSMTNGNSVNFNTTLRQQATTSMELAAGLTAEDQPLWAVIKGCLIAAKILIMAQCAVNLGVGTVLEIVEDQTLTGHKKASKSTANAIGIGASNAVTTALFLVGIKQIAERAEKLTHVSTLKLADDHIELDGTFATVVGQLMVNEAATMLSRQTKLGVIQSMLQLSSDTALLQAGPAASPSALTVAANSAVLKSGPAAGPSMLTMAANSAVLKTGPETGQSLLALTSTGAALAMKTAAGNKGFAINETGLTISHPTVQGTVEIVATGVNVNAELIKFG